MFEELLKAGFLSIFVVGSFITLMLLTRGHKDHGGNKSLALFIICLLLSPLVNYLSLAFGSVPKALVIASQCVILLYGPFVYLFIKIMISENGQLTLKHKLAHTAPFILLFAAKLAGLPIQNPFTWVVWYCAIFFYGFYNCYLLYQHRSLIQLIYAEYKNSAYYWLSYVVYGTLILTLIDMALISLFLLGIGTPYYLWMVLHACIGFYLVSIAAFSLWRPQVFFNHKSNAGKDQPAWSHTAIEPNLQKVTLAKSVSQELVNSSEGYTVNKKRELELSAEAAEELKRQLTQLMDTEQLAMKHELTLVKLADYLTITSNQMSELLNVHMNTSFYQFINQARLALAFNLLNDTSCRLSILDIAFAAGFNNKNTFYKVFKAETGITPNQYRQQNKAGLAAVS